MMITHRPHNAIDEKGNYLYLLLCNTTTTTYVCLHCVLPSSVFSPVLVTYLLTNYTSPLIPLFFAVSSVQYKYMLLLLLQSKSIALSVGWLVVVSCNNHHIIPTD